MTLTPKLPVAAPEGLTRMWYVTVAGRFVEGKVIVRPQDVNVATSADVSPRTSVSVAHVPELGVVTGALMFWFWVPAKVTSALCPGTSDTGHAPPLIEIEPVTSVAS